MGSWLLGNEQVRELLVGKRIVGIEFYEEFWDIALEGGRRVRLTAAQPAIPAPVIEVWQHADFIGDGSDPAPPSYADEHGSLGGYGGES